MNIVQIKKSKWQLSMVSGVCIGIETVIAESKEGTYSRIILNTILPDTDEQYAKEKKEIEGVMKYICDLHNKTSMI